MNKYLKRSRIITGIVALIFIYCTHDVATTGPVDSGSGIISIKAFAKPDALFPFIFDSAVVAVSAADMDTFYQNISVSGDSALGSISGITMGKNRIFTVTVFDSTKNRWCTGKDTIDLIDTRVHSVTIRLKMFQPNIISNDTIPGHQLKSDEVWNGTCFLRGDILISEGTTLTIKPGSTIKITTCAPDWDSSSNAKNRVEIFIKYGYLIAQGNKDSVITLALDSIYPKSRTWWGIGCYNSTLKVAFCDISSSEYGFFNYTEKNVFVCTNCMFSTMGMGIADFGGNNIFSNVTFNNIEYGFFVYNKNKVFEISLCNFAENSSIDILSIDSNQTITVRNSNFLSKRFFNLYISNSYSGFKGSVITADNCFNISNTNDNASGTIIVTNPAELRIPDAGCGFTSTLHQSTVLQKKVQVDPAEKVKMIREEWERVVNSQ